MHGYKTIYKELRGPLHRTAAIMSTLLLLIIAVSVFNAHIEGNRRMAKQALDNVMNSYRTAVDSEQILHNEAARFSTLQKFGFVGPEPRLRWVQDVRDVAAQTDIAVLHYALEPRKTHTTSLYTGGYQLYTSTMRLELELRHEGDLLEFLQQLESRHSGLFDVSNCTLQRANTNQPFSPHEPNVKAACKLLWYSLDTATAVQEEESL